MAGLNSLTWRLGQIPALAEPHPDFGFWFSPTCPAGREAWCRTGAANRQSGLIRGELGSRPTVLVQKRPDANLIFRYARIIMALIWRP